VTRLAATFHRRLTGPSFLAPPAGRLLRPLAGLAFLRRRRAGRPGHPLCRCRELAAGRTLAVARPAVGRTGDTCPDCGGTLQRTGSCQTCTSCGYNTGCG